MKSTFEDHIYGVVGYVKSDDTQVYMKQAGKVTELELQTLSFNCRQQTPWFSPQSKLL